MAQTPAQFFEKNAKWFVLVFIALFLFKTTQSCNRGMKLNITSKDYIHTIDSLENKINIMDKEYNATIEELKFELRLAKEKESAAIEKANAVQSVAEKVRANTTTTVNVRGAVSDTTKRK
jgi:topoisomerase IA-like protein